MRPKLLDLHSVMLNLQDPNVTMTEVRTLFDGVLAEYKIMNQYIRTNSTIIHSPHFESALVKLQRGQAHVLSKEEAKSVESLLVGHFCIPC